MTSARSACACGAVRAGLRREHRTQDGGPEGPAERAEEAGRRGRDAELAPIDAVLDGHDENLGDHAEAEAEHGERDAGGDLRGVAREGGEQDERHGHQRQARDREALVAPRAHDRPARERGRDGDAEHGRDEQQAGVGRAGARRRLQEERHEDGDREQRGGPEEQRGAGDGDRPGAQQVEGDDRVGGAALAHDQGAGQDDGRGDQARGPPPSPRRSAPRPRCRSASGRWSRRPAARHPPHQRAVGAGGLRRRQAQVRPASAAAPIGRLTRKTQRQLAWSTRTPPRSGPTMVATAKVAAM